MTFYLRYYVRETQRIAQYASKHPFSPSMLKSYNIERIRLISRAKYFLYQDKERTINHLHRYLDESFPELIPFLRKRGDIKRYQGRNFFDSKTTLWFVENFSSAKKFSNARSETAEKLRRMSNSNNNKWVHFNQKITRKKSKNFDHSHKIEVRSYFGGSGED